MFVFIVFVVYPQPIIECMAVLKKFLESKLQFVREKTRVSCRETFSILPRLFSESAILSAIGWGLLIILFSLFVSNRLPIRILRQLVVDQQIGSGNRPEVIALLIELTFGGHNDVTFLDHSAQVGNTILIDRRNATQRIVALLPVLDQLFVLADTLFSSPSHVVEPDHARRR